MNDKITSAPSAYHELIDFIALGGGPEAVIAFHPSQETQDRAYDLVYKERDGKLSEQEATELSRYVELEHIIRMAKIKARKIMANVV